MSLSCTVFRTSKLELVYTVQFETGETEENVVVKIPFLPWHSFLIVDLVTGTSKSVTVL